MESFKSFFLENKTYDYSCVMFNLPSKVTSIILNWSKANISENNLYKEHKMGRVKDIHITVLYGLHTNNYKKVYNKLKEFDTVKIKLGKVSKFENKDFDVIKIDVVGPALQIMNKKLRSLDYTSEHPTYIPHCTLAYVKKNSCDHLLGNKYFENKKIILDNLLFTPSIGKKVKLNNKKLSHEI